MGSDRIDRIRGLIASGKSLEELKRDYPVTRRLYERLGGERLRKKITLNSDFLEILAGTDKSREKGPYDKDVVIGSLLGDGNIYTGHQILTRFLSVIPGLKYRM